MRGVSEEKAQSAKDIRGAIILSIVRWSRFVSSGAAAASAAGYSMFGGLQSPPLHKNDE
jgi:hypothetical protein